MIVKDLVEHGFIKDDNQYIRQISDDATIIFEDDMSFCIVEDMKQYEGSHYPIFGEVKSVERLEALIFGLTGSNE